MSIFLHALCMLSLSFQLILITFKFLEGCGIFTTLELARVISYSEIDEKKDEILPPKYPNAPVIKILN